MAATNCGRIAMLPRGFYTSFNSYERLDVVLYNGSSYVCLTNCTGISPENVQYWQMFAKKGDKLQFGDLTDDEKEEIKGERGATGASGIQLTGSLEILDEKGQSTTAVMSQHAVTYELGQISNVISQIQSKLPDFIIDVKESGLYFVDENLNIGPHIKNNTPLGFTSYSEIPQGEYNDN